MDKKKQLTLRFTIDRKGLPPFDFFMHTHLRWIDDFSKAKEPSGK